MIFNNKRQQTITIEIKRLSTEYYLQVDKSLHRQTETIDSVDIIHTHNNNN